MIKFSSCYLVMIMLLSLCESTVLMTNYCARIPIESPTSELTLYNYDCNMKNLNSSIFESSLLPFRIGKLDFTKNNFESIPYLESESLEHLILAKNKISFIGDQIFTKLTNLKILDLSLNEINVISLNAFANLNQLKILDLSHNLLTRLNFLTFTHLINLNSLDLSWNQKLNQSNDLQSFDFFESLVLNTLLKELKLSYCNLNNIHLNSGRGLENLYLNGNNFKKVPDIPRYIKLLDMSENPIEIINGTFLPHLFNLEILIIEDMPKLELIDEYGFFGLPRLKQISLENCKQLKTFHLHAFGVNVIKNETDLNLEILNLRGTSLKTFNSSIFYAFEKLKYLNLEGAPLYCDCELDWIKKLNINVQGHCEEPESLRGKSVKEFECDWMSPSMHVFLNGLTILGLLLCFIGGFSLIFYMFFWKPKRKHISKIGSNSPYARITIEPNSAENHF